jgi:soluble lytic murein transglycosylase
MEALHLLRRLDPADTSGARFLWERGWREFAGRNPSGAVGYWSELRELYPDSRPARAALYWSGRAFAALGDARRADEVYRRVAATGTTDFYRKQALARLRAAAPAAASAPPRREAWPVDPLLERAEQFSALGLDDLALAELDAWRERADRRAVAALEALVLARKGARRDSLRLLREAFPSLGGPDQTTAPVEALALFYPFDYEPTVRSAATAHGLPPELVLAIIHQESGFDAAAVSRSGARGLMQVMPATGRELARRLGLRYSTSRLIEPEFSIRLGTAYFRQVLHMFDDNLELALAGYNGGPYRIKRLWRAQPTEIDAFLEGLTLEESKSYVKRILVLSDGYRQLYPKAG